MKYIQKLSPCTPFAEFSQSFTDNSITYFPELLVAALSAWIQEGDTNNLIVVEW